MSARLRVASSIISVVIRARNEERYLRALLPRLRSQQLPSLMQLQIIVVDNDSDDATAEVAAAFGAEVVPISTSSFSWGRALNLGIEAARGELVALVSADVGPVGDEWLASICRPFVKEEVAGVYGRQVPRVSAPLDEWVRINQRFPESERYWTVSDLSEKGVEGLIASNACGAIRRSVWEHHRYDEKSHGAEEIPWVRNVLEDGYRICYVVDAIVEHSHRDSAMKQALRIWELEMEARRVRGECVQIADGVRTVGSFAKRRLRNLRFSGAGIKRRLEGLFFLPWDAGFLAAVSFMTLCGKDFRVLRKRW